MLKQLVNEARFELTLTTRGPLLIKSGQPGTGETDMQPVVTVREGVLQPFIPGSSLKGVFRSHAERILRTLKPEAACNPFGRPKEVAPSEVSCGERFKQHIAQDRRLVDMDVAYPDACPACRLFGCTQFGSRFAAADAYLAAGEETHFERRDGVGIDRVTGGSARQTRALFALDAVPPGKQFTTTLQVRNFESWQLGLVLITLQDLCDGYVRLGMGRSRGLGDIEAKVDRAVLTAFGRHQPGRLDGLGAILAGSEQTYGTRADDHLTAPGTPRQRGLRWEWTLTGDELAPLADEALKRLDEFLAEWDVPERMNGERGRG